MALRARSKSKERVNMATLMNSAQLTKEKMALEKEIIDIESELQKLRAKARTTGVYADVEWFNKTVHSLNKKKLYLKQLNISISSMRGEEQKSNIIDAISSGTFKRHDDLKLVGVYLEPGIAEKLDKLGKQIGRGAKSSIANEALKEFFANKK
jgi:hypothetical protein